MDQLKRLLDRASDHFKAGIRNRRKQKRHSRRPSQQHTPLTPTSQQKTVAGHNDLATSLPTSSLPAAISQNSLQPAGSQASSQSDMRATEGTSTSAIVPEGPSNIPRIQTPTRQQIPQSDVANINQANHSGRLQLPQLERLSPGWHSGRGRSRSLPPSSEVSRERTPPPIVGEDPPTENIFPHGITVFLRLTFNSQPESSTEQEINDFDWTRPDCYKQLMPQGMVRKLQEQYPELKTQEMYRRYGSCWVEGPKGRDYDTPVSMVDDYEQLSQQAIINVCAFISNHSFKAFRLHVHWDYGSAQIQKPNEEQLSSLTYPESYIKMIRKELQKKVQKNFLGQEYIPRQDLEIFLKLEVIGNILVDDRSLDLDETERNKFRDEIQGKSPKLFAICVYRDIELRVLRHLMRKHDRGDNPDQRPSRGMGCNEDGCNNDNLQQIIGTLPMFFGEKIVFDYQHHDLEHEQILPLQNTGDLDPQGIVKRDVLGEGNSGKVFAVKIDLAHNILPGNADSRFAIKEYHNRDFFLREKEILTRFADFPNPHIVQHLTTWSQRNVYYILYNKARCNLRKYINNLDNPDLTGPHVLWFLRQLIGLASAINHVHHFKRPSPSNPEPRNDDYWGRHNDIKPENILVFEKAENQNPVFKVADFGLGVFYRPDGDTSHRDTLHNGTEGYFPPEKAVSRPFDMWALGCVFLELVLWLFGFYHDPNAKGFVTARMSFPGQGPADRIDNFWYEDPSQPGVYMRKPAVESALTELRTKHCQDMRAFQDILSAINKLLEVNPSRRYSSVTLLDKLKSILTQAEADINGRDGDSDYYKKKLKENLGGTEFGGELPSAGIDPGISPVRSRSHSFSSHHSVSSSGGPAMLAYMNPAPSVSAQSASPGEADALGRELDSLV